jgi:hypothetical protein
MDDRHGILPAAALRTVMRRLVASSVVLVLCVVPWPYAAQTDGREESFRSLLGEGAGSLDGWVIDYPGSDHATASAGELGDVPVAVEI